MIMMVVVGAAGGGSAWTGADAGAGATADGAGGTARGGVPPLGPQPVRTAAVANATRVMEVRRTGAPSMSWGGQAAAVSGAK
jgi:hypothetical protein